MEKSKHREHQFRCENQSYHFAVVHCILLGLENVIFQDTGLAGVAGVAGGCQFQVEVATSSALYYWNKHVFIYCK